MIDEVVAAVLHNKVPVSVVDKVDVPLQLSNTFTVGVVGMQLIGELGSVEASVNGLKEDTEVAVTVPVVAGVKPAWVAPVPACSHAEVELFQCATSKFATVPTPEPR